MSREQYGLGEHRGYERGYKDGWNRGYDAGSSSDTLGFAIGLGAAAVAGIAGFIAGRSENNNKYISYECRRCGNSFEIPQGSRPSCPYCSDNYDDDDDDEW